MNRIIPFKKELTFKTNVSEITSIALENTLHSNKQIVEGDLIINGTYKITETSTQTDEFEFKIPINIEIDKKYILDELTIDINDFYYELINNSILEVNIEVSLDNLIEATIENNETINQDSKKEQEIMREINIKKPEPLEIQNTEKRCIEEETKDEINIFNNFSDEIEDYSTYHIYIVREGDSVETIMSKYGVTNETIQEYNDLSEIKIGDKIIIPQNNARNQ